MKYGCVVTAADVWKLKSSKTSDKLITNSLITRSKRLTGFHVRGKVVPYLVVQLVSSVPQQEADHFLHILVYATEHTIINQQPTYKKTTRISGFIEYMEHTVQFHERTLRR